jgi:hypothetical protein
VTAAVHYVRFVLDGALRERFATGPVTIATELEAYSHRTRISEETRASIVSDWGR